MFLYECFQECYALEQLGSNLLPSVQLGCIDQKVQLGCIDQKVQLGCIDQKVQLGCIDQKVQLGCIDQKVQGFFKCKMEQSDKYMDYCKLRLHF
jgi:hydrogenase maturation factor